MHAIKMMVLQDMDIINMMAEILHLKRSMISLPISNLILISSRCLVVNVVEIGVFVFEELQ
jgi:hypothetical protein